MTNINDLIERILSVETKGFLKIIGDAADAAGERVFLVGGTVRDLFLEKENADIDVAVEGDAIKFSGKINKKIPGKLTVYKKFGTATLLVKGSETLSGRLFPDDKVRIDLAGTRKERYASPAAMPEVRPGTIREDLARRDFTVNAIAVSMNAADRGNVLDLFDGAEDIKNGRIRALHDKSFFDDPTRIFRAARFEGRLLSFRIEERTEALIRQAILAGMLARTERRRIREELGLIAKENSAKTILSRLHELGAGAYLSAGLTDPLPDKLEG
ncbi:MAG: hypothetical protein KKG84_00225 [Candidatus Omnitrophica bacterium]|nr:hypothetical protein [Candidatus Omnitrophota bacterium]